VIGALALALILLVPGAAGAGEFLKDTHDGRAYRLFVPDAPRSEAPLVLALHGCWQTPEDFATGTRLNAAAERLGLTVLYPAQTRRDNAYRCWNWFQPSSHVATTGETAELVRLARRVQRERGIRERRVLVIGFSAGGFMAVNLACAAPDLVRGIGVSAAGPYRCASGPEAAIQCMRGVIRDGTDAARTCLAAAGARRLALRAALWHGGADAVVAPANLAALEVMFARALNATASTSDRRDAAVRSVYRDGAGRPVLETWLVPPMGHAWSGGHPRGTHTFPAGPDATTRILDFLLQGPAPEREPLGER
jgi:poly(hydroxyalkanoate) depolymerase family esterase